MAIGMPVIEVAFEKKAVTAIARSSRGVVGIVIVDDTDQTFDKVSIKTSSDIVEANFTAENVQYIKDVLSCGVSELIVSRVDTTAPITDAFTVFEAIKVDWVAIAGGDAADQEELVTWVKSYNTVRMKTVKAVVHQAVAPDDMHIVNFMNDEVTLAGESEATAGNLETHYLAARAAVTPLTKSMVYGYIGRYDSVKEVADRDTAINDGGFILYNDEGKVRVGRGVNSLQTLSDGQTDDHKFITIVETLDLIYNDVTTTIDDEYKGAFKNTPDNQALLLPAIDGYLASLTNDGILDRSFKNKAYIDIEAQRAANLSIGKADAVDWDDATVKLNCVGTLVFLMQNIKVPNCGEDFYVKSYMQ
jgi:hypothetical protein